MTEEKKKKDSKSKLCKIKDSFKFNMENGLDFENRTIQLYGSIGETVDVDFVDSAISALELHNKKTITIKINSYGGSVHEALAIIGRIKASKCQITTEAYGAVMSASVLILACGDKRRMSEYCTFMHHASSYVIGGDHDRIKDEVAQYEREEKLWCVWMEKFSTTPADKWRKMAHKKNLYLTADQTLRTGLIDEVF